MTVLNVPLSITELDGIARVRQPVTMGLPLPKGLVRATERLALRGPDSARQPLQAGALSRWADGSIKWALLDFQADVAPHACATYVLYADDGPARGDAHPRLDVDVQGDYFTVTTGAATFSVSRQRLDPACLATIDGVRWIDSERSCCLLEDSTGQTFVPVIRSAAVETRGELRTTLRLDGAFRRDATALCDFVARISFFAGSATIRLALTVRNPRPARHRNNCWDLGDPGSVSIRDLSLHIALAAPGPGVATWSDTPGSPLVHAPADDVELYQDSSGGPNWASLNHVNAQNRVPTSFRGYRVRARGIERTGDRAQPLMAVHAARSGVVAAVSHFWQNFPKALEVADGNRLTVRLFPRQYGDTYELQGGEQKTHVVHLSFLRDPRDMSAVEWTRGQVLARAPEEWYAVSRAIPYLTPRAADPNREYLELVDLAIEGDSSFAAKREIVDEYGWRHFGDVYADHEAVHYNGAPPVISHYNNQYDVIYGGVVQFLRSGDTRWFFMLDELASHVVDIDIYHTEGDRAEYAGGFFWHTNHYTSAFTATHRTFSRAATLPGGGPSSGHCYTTGLMHHYFLTGDVASRDAVVGLAGWILAMEDGARSRFRWLDRGPTGCATATHTRSYHGPGRGPANAVNALLDASLLTGERVYMDAAEGLIRRCVHPNDDLERRHLGDSETRWSYTMFLQVLGRYLDAKVELGQIDAMYGHARASLLAYAMWLAEHEVPYLSRSERLEFPTETWSAQDMRKSDVLKFAAKHSSGAERDRFLARSEFFFQSSVAELSASKTRHFTRPVAIMMTNGYMDAHFRQHPDETAPPPPAGLAFGTPRPFRSQRDRVLRKAAAGGVASLVASIALAYRYWRK